MVWQNICEWINKWIVINKSPLACCFILIISESNDSWMKYLVKSRWDQMVLVGSNSMGKMLNN